MNSPFFQLKDFNFEHYCPYSIIFEYPFVKDGEVQIRQHKIMTRGEMYPNRKTIKFTEKQTPKQQVIEVKIYYDKSENISAPNPLLRIFYFNSLETYLITLPQVKEEQFNFVLTFYMDVNGMPHIDKATINETYYEEVPIKTTKPAATTTTEAKEGEAKTEEPPKEEPKTEKVKKERQNVCIIKLVECNYGLHPSILTVIFFKVEFNPKRS